MLRSGGAGFAKMNARFHSTFALVQADMSVISPICSNIAEDPSPIPFGIVGAPIRLFWYGSTDHRCDAAESAMCRR